MLPRLHETLGTTGPAVLMGASLGALAALHLQRRHPDLVAGLFLQSELLHPEIDACESASAFGRITAAVTRCTARSGRTGCRRVTCGVDEENRHTTDMEATAPAGLPGKWRGAGSQQTTGLAGAFDPHLAGLLQQVGGI